MDISNMLVLKSWLTCLLSLLVCSCIDPVAPEFEFKDDLLFIEGFASTNLEESFVALNIFTIEFGKYRPVFVEGATINFESLDTGQKVLLFVKDGQYIPPKEFAVKVGETWMLNVLLPNGNRYTSPPEKILSAVPITALGVTYEPELEFRELEDGKFIPGHSLTITFTDPPTQENYYYWTYRTYEDLDFCQTCFNDQAFREGECSDFNTSLPARLDYICEVPCWRIRYPENVSIYTDEFSNGKTVSKLFIGNL